MPPICLRPATNDDLPFVLRAERLPGYERLIGRSSEAEHRARLADPDQVILLGSLAGSEPFGFAILRGLADRHGNLLLQRIAVLEPGLGLGRPFLSALLAWSWAHPEVHRLWLDVFAANERARRVYGRLGFVEEGTLREAHCLPDGTRTDLLLMAMLRSEWAARQGGSG